MSKGLYTSPLGAGAAVQNAQAQLGNTQQLGGAAAGNIYINQGTGNIMIGGAGTYTITGTFAQNPLSKEEAAELAILQEQFNLENKAAKLEEFKKIDPTLRQQIINAFLWEESVNKINEYSAPKSPRLIELQSRNNSSFNLGQSVSWYSSYVPYNTTPRLPNDISTEDLKMAHMEASMEEQVIDEDNK